jgi:uncharacterized membrane protein (DUF4010 family)
MTPGLLGPFLLTLAVSALIGIGLREYYEGEKKLDTFGTVRTFVFIGVLGFVLIRLPEIGTQAYLLGYAALTLLMLTYYWEKLVIRKSPGMIGVLLALLTYATGPVAVSQPYWYLVLLAISVLLVLHSKGRIRQFTDRLETGEIVTVCKFLAIVGVVLPLIPDKPITEGLAGQVLAALPVTPRQIWIAVVVTTAISYFGYVLQTYLYPRRGLLLAGILGGIYSSTVTVVVLAKKSKATPAVETQAARAIMLAVAMMYLRLVALVAIFRHQALWSAAPPLCVLGAAAAGYAVWLRTRRSTVEASATLHGNTVEPTDRRNPLELNAAFFFALMFVIVALVTKYVLDAYKDLGLRMLSFVVGFSDITPFVVSVLQGNLGIGDRLIVHAIIIASASNNLLKTAYTYALGSRRTANLVAPAMLSLIVLSAVFAAVWL